MAPKRDVVLGGRVLWKHGTTYEYVRNALNAYHECASGDLDGRHKAIGVLANAVETYLTKKDGRHTASVRLLNQAVERERTILAERIRDAIQARELRSPSVADVLRAGTAGAAGADESEAGEVDPLDTSPSDTKTYPVRRSPSTSFSTPSPRLSLSVSNSASSEVGPGPDSASPRAAELEFNLYARTASATKLSRTVLTSGLLHAALLTTDATRKDGEIVRPDLVIGGVVIKKNSTKMKRLLESLDGYHALQPYQLHARQAALKQLEDDIEAYLAKRDGRYKDAPAFLNFRAKLEQEAHTVTALIAINVEAEWQRDNGKLPAPADPRPQLNAQDAADLIRAGVPNDTIARGMAMHLSHEQIAQELAPCARARVPYTAPTRDPAYQQSAIVPGTLRKLGRGAVNTAWRIDYQVGERTRPMVFKPEPSSRTDIGEMALASGIPAREANLSGRSAAAYACSKFLNLDLVPPTVVAIVDMDASPEVGSLMEFVEGFQLVSEGCAKRPLTTEQARLVAAYPEVLNAYARECGCTSAHLDGTVLHLERRVLVNYDAEGALLEGDQLREVPALVRMALPLGDGRMRRLLADAQLFSRFIRDGDRSPMNFMFSLTHEGQLVPRFIDNDVTFGPDWNIRSEPGTSIAERRVELPRYVSRSLKNAFDRLSADLGDELEALLGDPRMARSVLEDAGYVKAMLATYDKEGRILDEDADWEQPAVTEALGLDLARSRFDEALALRDGKGQPSFKSADAQIDKLERSASTRSYLAREGMAQRVLALNWEALRLSGQGKDEPPERYFGLVALFDFEELMRRVRAASARSEADVAARPAMKAPSLVDATIAPH